MRDVWTSPMREVRYIRIDTEDLQDVDDPENPTQFQLCVAAGPELWKVDYAEYVSPRGRVCIIKNRFGHWGWLEPFGK